MKNNFSCLSIIQIDVPDFKGGRPLMLKSCEAYREGSPSGYLHIILVITDDFNSSIITKKIALITRIMLLSFGAFETTYFCVIAKQLSRYFQSGVLFIWVSLKNVL